MKGSAPDTGSMSILEAAQDVRLGSTPPRLGLVTRDAFGWTPLRRGVSRPEVEELTGDSAASVSGSELNRLQEQFPDEGRYLIVEKTLTSLTLLQSLCSRMTKELFQEL